MQVEPARLVELAAVSETVLAAMTDDWAAVRADLSAACESLGDAAGALEVSTTYADSLAGAEEVVSALVATLGLGIAGLVDAAQDAQRADDTVATELDRVAHLLQQHDRGGPSKGGR